MDAYTQPVKPKYQVGDFVFSIQNLDRKKEIKRIKLSINPDFQHKYKLLCFDAKGTAFNSRWINEDEIFTKKLNKTQKIKLWKRSLR